MTSRRTISAGEQLRFGLAMTVLVALGGCDDPAPPVHLRIVGGDVEQGRHLVRVYGCPACHVIPGVREARGTVGPPLNAFGARAYIAGQHPNRPDTLVRWIENPPLMVPDTAMPNMGVSSAEARHIAAYLYALR